jgi:hypothetical protein
VTKGILYIATDDSYLKDAEKSAERANTILDLPISIVSHKEPECNIFDETIIDNNPTKTMADKSGNLLKTPYDNTIYVDSDTYIIEDITDIFERVGSSIPLAITLDIHEGSLYKNDDLDIPSSFPMYQAGVIVYQDTPILRDFIQKWQENHDPPDSSDQVSFRKTLYNHRIQINIFPLRYNAFMGTEIYGPVKILHDYQGILKKYNRDKLHRILNNINDDNDLRRLDSFHFSYIPEKPLSWHFLLRLGLAAIYRGYLGIRIWSGKGP